MQTDNSLKTKQFTIRARARSFRFALEGIYRFFAEEHNARIHLLATIMTFLFAWLFRISRYEIVLLIIVTGFVWVAEILNSSIEKMMDFVQPGYHPKVKLIKDLAAAAVLVAALIALATGAYIFIPKIF